MNQQSPLGWGQPTSERGPRPQVSSPRPYSDLEAEQIREIGKEIDILRDPAGDRPFVGHVTFGVLLQGLGLVILVVGIYIQIQDPTAPLTTISDASFPTISLIGLGIGTVGAIAMLLGLHRALSALQIIYRLVKRI